MAPVLQCPDCGTKHPLGEVPQQGAFPCKGCGRVLKVPETATAAAPAAAVPAPAPAPAPEPPPNPAPVAPPDPVATAVAPVVAATPPPEPAPAPESAPAKEPSRAPKPIDERRLGSVPWWMRLLLWFVAVPLGFFIVFGVARAFGLFTSSDMSDLFLANGTDRFWPVARLLPFVALMIALLVQGGIYALARLRAPRSTRQPVGSAR